MSVGDLSPRQMETLARANDAWDHVPWDCDERDLVFLVRRGLVEVRDEGFEFSWRWTVRGENLVMEGVTL